MKLKKWLENPDTVGWLMWGACALALVWPMLALIRSLTYDSTTPIGTRIFVAVFASAILSGFITWAINEIWFRVKQRRMASKGRGKSGKKRAKR